MLKTTLKLSFFYLKLVLKYKLYIVLKLLLLKILFETLRCLKLKGRRHLILFEI